jgi:D-cysteine desulfhydrase family pyridoxal phosphate-dependent enzyme
MSTTTSPQGAAAALERRVSLAQLPTPLHPLDRLARHLGRASGSILAKRDDLTGLAGGGNKTRKLEYLLQDALDQGCDVVVTGAGVQSNHCRQTAAGAAAVGLRCVLVLGGARPERPSGNLVLDEVCGAEIRFAPAAQDLEAEIQSVCDELRLEGARPYALPVGGSVALGALGYVRAGLELKEQHDSFDVVVLGTGSCGTQGGLAAGLGGHERIRGIRIGERQDIRSRVERIAREAAALAGLPEPTGSCILDEGQLGAGYAHPTEAGWEAIKLVGSLEGVILDPVYTGKAMAGLIDGCRSGAIARDQQVVFLHTGGMPGLLAERYLAWRWQS